MAAILLILLLALILFGIGFTLHYLWIRGGDRFHLLAGRVRIPVGCRQRAPLVLLVRGHWY